MKYLFDLSLSLALLLLLFQAPPADKAAPGPGEVAFYVSPTGDDQNPGTAARPFRTLERARDSIRERKKSQQPWPKGGITVWLGEGEYFRSSPFSLTALDAGQEGAPVRYRALHGRAARLIAGQAVDPAAVRPVKDPATLQRLDPKARPHLVELDLASFRKEHLQPFPDVFNNSGGLIDLFFDNQRMPLARYPNSGFMTMQEVLDPGEQGPGTFMYRDDRHRRWVRQVPKGLWLKGYWRVPWQNEAVRVAAIDTVSRTVTLAGRVPGGIGDKYTRPKGSGKEPYWLLNLPEEIDFPGEWAVDFDQRKLYFWPPAPVTEGKLLVADNSSPLLTLQEVSHVQFQGLLLEGGLGNAVEMTGGTDNLLAGCTIRNFGGNAVTIRGGKRHGVQSCDIHDMGAGGVTVRAGDRITLENAEHFILNNHIHDFSQITRVYTPAVHIHNESVGIRVAHNLIHDTPHVALQYGGNNHLIEHNEIFNFSLGGNDMGAIYSWLDWTSRGTTIRYNYIHDSKSGKGIYWDDGDSGDTAYGNILANLESGIFIGGGHENKAVNNLLLNCTQTALYLDGRGVERNFSLSNQGLMKPLQAVDVRNPPWSTQFPALVRLLEPDFRRELPLGTVFAKNLAVNCKKLYNFPPEKAAEWEVQLKQNKLTEDQEQRLAKSLAAGKLDMAAIRRHLPDFDDLAFSKIGLQKDEYRKDGKNPLQ